MQATRIRVHVGPAFEWLVAAAFLVATLSVASLIIRELTFRPATTTPVAVDPAPSASPAAVPDRAVSVPALLLLDGGQIRVGDTSARVAEVLGGAEAVRQVVDRGALGERITRFYEHRGTRFVLVLEPFERNGTPRVAAIYLQ